MRFRKSAIVLIVAVLLLAAAFIYFDTRLLEQIKQASQEQEGTQSQEQIGGAGTSDVSGRDGDTSYSDSGDGISNTLGREIIASENVPVDFNSPEYDIEITLCQDSDNKAFLRLKYYIDGASWVNDLYEEQLTELANIFENRERELKRNEELQGGSRADGDISMKDAQERITVPYTIGQALLNPVYGQLYILINGAPIDSYTQSSFYCIDLYDVSVKKLFSYPARYGKISFNSDFSMLAYDFEDPLHMSMYQEDSIFEVYSCAAEEYLVKGSRRLDQSPIGLDGEPGYIIDYMFMGWEAPDIVKLIRTSRPNEDTVAEPVFTEVIYDIITDNMFNPDGSEIGKIDVGQGNEPSGAGTEENDVNAEAGGKTKDPGGEPGKKPDDGSAAGKASEIEMVNQLKSFYSYLGSESDYSKGMQLLDDGFILKLGMLKQFGIDEVRKSDIDAQYGQGNVSMYAELLKAARLDRVVSAEILDNGEGSITYYQILGLSTDSKLSQLMSARLVKKDKTWMIKLIEDGKE